MLRIAWLSSRRAPGLEYLLEHQRGYEVVVGLTTDPASEALPVLRRAGVPALVHDIRAGGAQRSLRHAFDERTRELLAPYAPDLIVLSGYLHIVTTPLLSAYPGRILNVHDADLTVLGPDGHRRYRGLHATRDAIRAGETTTRCTAHVVTADVDAGPILAQSCAFAVAGRHHYLQRELMMREGWGPVIEQAFAALVAEPVVA